METKTRYLSTGQAADLCSVTPDTVLKWIRSGRLPARRTAGGHHRIDQKDLESLITPISEIPSKETEIPEPVRRQFRYCWEYNSEGQLSDRCRRCPAYLMRAQRCYEVAKLEPSIGHTKTFCKGDCLDCDYYRQVHLQGTNVMVVTDDGSLIQSLKDQKTEAPYSHRFAISVIKG